MKHVERIAPVAAALSALATLACCLPIALTAGTAMAGLAALAGSYQQWFLGASAALLTVGGARFVRARRDCARRDAGSMVIFGVSAAIVLLVLFFPQIVAGLLADWMP